MGKKKKAVTSESAADGITLEETLTSEVPAETPKMDAEAQERARSNTNKGKKTTKSPIKLNYTNLTSFILSLYEHPTVKLKTKDLTSINEIDYPDSLDELAERYAQDIYLKVPLLLIDAAKGLNPDAPVARAIFVHCEKAIQLHPVVAAKQIEVITEVSSLMSEVRASLDIIPFTSIGFSDSKRFVSAKPKIMKSIFTLAWTLKVFTSEVEISEFISSYSINFLQGKPRPRQESLHTRVIIELLSSKETNLEIYQLFRSFIENRDNLNIENAQLTVQIQNLAHEIDSKNAFLAELNQQVAYLERQNSELKQNIEVVNAQLESENWTAAARLAHLEEIYLHKSEAVLRHLIESLDALKVTIDRFENKESETFMILAVSRQRLEIAISETEQAITELRGDIR